MDAQLTALVVHDLKNALGNLESQLLLVERAPDVAGAARARRSCEQLRRDLVAFLTLYRGEGLRAAVEDESPLRLLRSLAESAQANTPRLRIEVCLASDAPPYSPPFWYFDPRLVRLALDAALNNACRYARSQVWLRATVLEQQLVLAIEDDGPGLTHSAPGEWSTGLGTELCRAVARAHRSGERVGHVELVQRAGGGARFELWLP